MHAILFIALRAIPPVKKLDPHLEIMKVASERLPGMCNNDIEFRN